MTNKNPDVLLLTSNHCIHCQALKTILIGLMNQGAFSSLDIINIEDHPEVAKKHRVRSVPWLRLGIYDFNEGLSRAELRDWLTWIKSENGNSHYIEYLLLNGKLNNALDWIERTKTSLNDVLGLITKADVKINVRIGIGAIMEHFDGSNKIGECIPLMSTLMSHDNAEIRADIGYYLMLTRDKSVIRLLQALLSDEDKHVREIAAESIDELG